MATREATIRVNIKVGSFKSGMKKIQTDSKTTGKKVESSLREPIKKGVKAAKASLGELGSALRDNIKLAATFGGAFAVGALTKSAIDATSQYKALTVQFEKFTGQAVETADIQERINSVAGDTKVPLQQVRDSFAQVVAVVKDLDDAEDAMKRINLQAKRLGTEPELIARSFTRLKSKTGQSNEEIEMMIEQFEKFGRTALGIDLDEAIDPNDIAEFSAFANRANLSIAESMKIVQAVGGKGTKDLGEVGEIIEEIAINMQNVQAVGDIAKKLKIDPKELNSSKGALENLSTILTEGGVKGAKELLSSFGNERTKDALKKLIGEDLVAEIETAKKSRALEAELGQKLQARASEISAIAGQQFDDAKERARIEEANKKLTTGASANLQDALNKLEEAFQKPKVLAAIDKLAEKLPELAEVIADLVGFVADNPLLSGGLLVGGKVGGSFAANAAGELGKNVLLGKEGKGGDRAGGLIGKVMNEAGPKLAASINGSAANFGKTLAGTAGPIMGVAMAGAVGVAIGTELGKIIFDPQAEKGKQLQMKGFATEVEALKQARSNKIVGGQAVDKRAAFDKLQAEFKRIQSEKSFLSSAGDNFQANIGIDEKDRLNSPERQALKSLTEEMIKLRDEIIATEKAAQKAKQGLDTAGSAGSSAAGKLRTIQPPTGGGGGEGLGPVQPGASPRPGTQ